MLSWRSHYTYIYLLLYVCVYRMGLSRWVNGKESSCNVGNVSSIPGSGRSPGGGHGNPLQYSCLENLTDRGAWWAAVHRVAKSLTQSDFACTHLTERPWPLKSPYTPLLVSRLFEQRLRYPEVLAEDTLPQGLNTCLLGVISCLAWIEC